MYHIPISMFVSPTATINHEELMKLANRFPIFRIPVHKIVGGVISHTLMDGVWSGKFSLPLIETRVKSLINNLGTGKVVGYHVQAGYIAVQVKLDESPKWRDIQLRRNYPNVKHIEDIPAILYGAEVEVI